MHASNPDRRNHLMSAADHSLRSPSETIYMASECIVGSYCAIDGLDGPTGECDAGYYCSGGAIVATPDSSSEDGYQGDTCVDRSNATTNDICPPGHYCPQGAIATTTIFVIEVVLNISIFRPHLDRLSCCGAAAFLCHASCFVIIVQVLRSCFLPQHTHAPCE